MPRSGFSGSFRSPKIDVVIDMGNPFLNRTVDGFLKIGAVGACKVAAEETFDCLHRGARARPEYLASSHHWMSFFRTSLYPALYIQPCLNDCNGERNRLTFFQFLTDAIFRMTAVLLFADKEIIDLHHSLLLSLFF